jgi:hypothetical protein
LLYLCYTGCLLKAILLIYHLYLLWSVTNMNKYSPERIRSLKTISVTAKCSDCFFLEGTTAEGENIDYEGYVPHGLNIGAGDYLELTIDLETGKILNWKPVTPDSLEETFRQIIAK